MVWTARIKPGVWCLMVTVVSRDSLRWVPGEAQHSRHSAETDTLIELQETWFNPRWDKVYYLAPEVLPWGEWQRGPMGYFKKSRAYLSNGRVPGTTLKGLVLTRSFWGFALNTVLQAIETNPENSIWRVSGDFSISMSCVVRHFHKLDKKHPELCLKLAKY